MKDTWSIPISCLLPNELAQAPTRGKPVGIVALCREGVRRLNLGCDRLLKIMLLFRIVDTGLNRYDVIVQLLVLRCSLVDLGKLKG